MFIFAVLFGVFWRGAWLYYLRYRDNTVAIVAYASLLPFMLTWMHGNFILPATQVAMVLAVDRRRGGALPYANTGHQCELVRPRP